MSDTLFAVEAAINSNVEINDLQCVVCAVKPLSKRSPTSALDYSFSHHLKGRDADIRKLSKLINEYILSLNRSLEQVPMKHYVAYKAPQNVICMKVLTKKIKLLLKLDSSAIPSDTPYYRDLKNISFIVGCEREFLITTEAEFHEIKDFLGMAVTAEMNG